MPHDERGWWVTHSHTLDNSGTLKVLIKISTLHFTVRSDACGDYSGSVGEVRFSE